MNKLSYDAAWADLVAMARSNASVLAILAGAFLLLPNFAELLFAPPPNVRAFDWNGLRQMQDYYREKWLILAVCSLPIWLGSAGILALLVDPRRLTVGEALKSGLRLLPGVVVLSWLTRLYVALALLLVVVPALLLLLVPWLYLIGRLALAAPAQMAERVGNPIRALRRSFALTVGNGWRIAGLVVLAFVVTTIVALVVIVVVGLLFNAALPEAVRGEGLALLRSTVLAGVALFILLLGAALYRQLSPAR